MSRRVSDVPADEHQRNQRLAKARQEGRETGRGWVKWLRAYHRTLFAEHLDDLAGKAEATAWYHQREAAKATAEAEVLRAQTPEASTEDPDAWEAAHPEWTKTDQTEG